jgi:hypothetical protein
MREAKQGEVTRALYFALLYQGRYRVHAPRRRTFGRASNLDRRHSRQPILHPVVPTRVLGASDRSNKPEPLRYPLSASFLGAAAQPRAGRATHSTVAPNAAASSSTHRLASPIDEQLWVAGARRDSAAAATKAASISSPSRRSIHAKSLSSFGMLKPHDGAMQWT